MSTKQQGTWRVPQTLPVNDTSILQILQHVIKINLLTLASSKALRRDGVS